MVKEDWEVKGLGGLLGKAGAGGEEVDLDLVPTLSSISTGKGAASALAHFLSTYFNRKYSTR